MWCRYVCPCMCYVAFAMLFTCTQVISHPVSKEGVECETWAVRTNSKILGGPEQTRNILGKENQQEAQSNPGSRPWRTYLRGAPGRWPFKYVQSYDCIIACMKEIAMSFCNMLPVFYHDYSVSVSSITMLIDVYFSQVKNKPWLPWVYSWIRHCREHGVPYSKSKSKIILGGSTGAKMVIFWQTSLNRKMSCKCTLKTLHVYVHLKQV